MSISSTRKSRFHAPRSKHYHGPFGRLFRELPPWKSPKSDDASVVAELQRFANDAMSESANEPDADNRNLPAGYTYFGQFVDHDITFDPTSSLMRQNDPDRLHNFRTPRLDLDCIYGEGPHDEPFMYDTARDGQQGTFLIGKVRKTWDGKDVTDSNEPDLPRNAQGRAIIGDMRNDENLIVSQFQLAMLQLHNRVLRQLSLDDPDDRTTPFKFDNALFEEAQRKVRWFYQYVVWNDFVKRLVSDAIWKRVLDQNNCLRFRGLVFNWKHQPFIPVEFSVSAYRFGHSLIRPGYQVNLNSDVGLGFGTELPIFHPEGKTDANGNPRHDLRGFRFFPSRHTIQWDWFFDIDSPETFPQPSRRIDPKLSSAVFKIGEGPNPPNRLAFLNLLRSFRMDMPSGTEVAKRMCLTPHAIDDPHEDVLWHYILQESANLPANNSGRMLGKVGGTIVAEVFGGLLAGDPSGYVRNAPQWTPNQDEDLMALMDSPQGPINGTWEVADLLRAANAPINGDDVANTIDKGFS